MQRSYQAGLWLTGICITLMGCGSPFVPTPPMEEKKYDLKHDRTVLALNFPRHKAALTIEEQLDLYDHLQTPGPGKTSTHVTMTCKTSGLTGKRVHYLTKYLLSLGIKQKQIHCTSHLDPETATTLDIIIDRYRVTVPRCPDWRMGMGDFQGHRAHSNYGCATLTNYLLMIDDPIILFKGTPAIVHDASREALAVSDFRAGKDKGKELKMEKIDSASKSN